MTFGSMFIIIEEKRRPESQAGVSLATGFGPDHLLEWSIVMTDRQLRGHAGILKLAVSK